MTKMREEDFGSFARQKRLDAGLSLREAARRMGISAAFLSRVENNIEPPSETLLTAMSKMYAVELWTLLDKNHKTKRANFSAYGRAVQSNPELRALYRLASQMEPGHVNELNDHLRKFLLNFLKEKGATPEEIEKRLADLKLELPRISKAPQDGLFAAKARPRRLTKWRIHQMACSFLAERGLTSGTYSPPTQIELLVEREPAIRYRIDDKLKRRENGEPLVLGLTGFDAVGEAQIVISGALADSQKSSDQCRFNFTLAHELFHAIEHLPLVENASGVMMKRVQFCPAVVDLQPSKIPSAAERAVKVWATNSSRRVPFSDEDWREWQANTFASAVLMPEWSIVAEFEKRMDTDYLVCEPETNPREMALDIAGEKIFHAAVYVQSLSEKYAVSRQAMAIRLLELGLVREVID
jgi:transcriptional regulator with XRE-family HTH domain